MTTKPAVLAEQAPTVKMLLDGKSVSYTHLASPKVFNNAASPSSA